MSTEDRERRRIAVRDKLREATSNKLLHGGLHIALDAATEAYRLAKEEPPVEQPWPALAAYRLAHLKLQSGAASDEDLRAVDALFLEAGSSRVLGSLPRVYRLAILDRLARSAKAGKRRQDFKQELQNAFEDACRDIDGPAGEDPAIQSGSFNMLELAAYFLERDQALPRGRGARRDRFEGLFNSRGWFLVGPCPEIAEVRMAEAIALAEFEARIEADEGALWFVLAEPRRSLGRLQKYSARELNDLGDRESKLLTCILKGRASTSMEEVRATTGTEDKDYFRQVLRRLRVVLGKHVGKPPTETVVKGSYGLHHIADGIRIYGCVDRKK